MGHERWAPRWKSCTTSHAGVIWWWHGQLFYIVATTNPRLSWPGTQGFLVCLDGTVTKHQYLTTSTWEHEGWNETTEFSFLVSPNKSIFFFFFLILKVNFLIYEMTQSTVFTATPRVLGCLRRLLSRPYVSCSCEKKGTFWLNLLVETWHS